MDLSRLTAAERRILHFVSANPAASRTDVANGIGLSRQRVSALMNGSGLRTAITELQREQIEENGRIASGAATLAIRTLASILNDDSATNSEKIRAATALLAYTPHAPEPPDLPVTWVVTVDEDGNLRQEKEDGGNI